MKWLVNNFLKGCLVLFPIAGSVYVVWFVLRTLDHLAPLPIPGLGLVLSIAVITTVGFVASNVVGQRLFGLVEHLFRQVPLVRLLYSAIQDMVGAFVGERRSFDKPAMVRVSEGVRVFGFVTAEVLPDPSLVDHVAVYLPQSYNFAGNLIVVPRERVERIDADGAEFLAFVVSGGISTIGRARLPG